MKILVKGVSFLLEKYSDILTLNELCNILHIGKSTAYKLIRSNEIKSRKIGGKFLIQKQNLIEYLCT